MRGVPGKDVGSCELARGGFWQLEDSSGRSLLFVLLLMPQNRLEYIIENVDSGRNHLFSFYRNGSTTLVQINIWIWKPLRLEPQFEESEIKARIPYKLVYC
jgi:hypothetical protein